MTKVNSLLKYADDFSEFYDARTLVDQGYVDAKFASIASVLKMKGGIDGSTGTVTAPAAGDLGDTYYVTGAPTNGATFFDSTVRNGDSIIVITAYANNSATAANFIVLEKNEDLATSAIAGLIKIATQAIANQGTDNTMAITALTLAGYLANGQYTKKIAAINPILNAVNKKCVWTIPNPLTSPDVIVQIAETATQDIVAANINITSANITITFNSRNDIPAGTYKLVGIGI